MRIQGLTHDSQANQNLSHVMILNLAKNSHLFFWIHYIQATDKILNPEFCNHNRET